MSRIALTLAAAAAVAVSLLAAAAAGAHGNDRNRDRIPDRWEQRHHLSLAVKQTRRDQDHDGLDNLGEYRSHTDPRDRDSDDDGIGDDEENAGTVASFSNGVLAITLAKGGSLTGRVTDETEIECGDDAKATASDDDGDHDHGDDDQEDSCGAEALSAGRAVEEAELKARDGEAVFEEIELGA